jgi:hypothetical protein
MKSFILAIFAVIAVFAAHVAARAPWGDIPYPFTRDLEYNAKAPMTGKDVYALQALLNRWAKSPGIQLNSVYDQTTAMTLRLWKESVTKAPADDKFDIAATAYDLLDAFFYDKYKDRALKAADLGLKFRVHIPVHKDRSIETMATLYDANNNVLHRYPARTRAHTVIGEEEWPSWDSDGAGLIDLSSNGFTPSGLTLIDLNTPEPAEYEDLYGKWNVLRAVRGLEGNANIEIPKLRNGILQHTGNWAKHGWMEDTPMPNSAGCIHVHPKDQETVTQLLASIGVIANKNPLGLLPYPFKPQGLLSIEVIDDDDHRFDVVRPDAVRSCP